MVYLYIWSLKAEICKYRTGLSPQRAPSREQVVVGGGAGWWLHVVEPWSSSIECLLEELLFDLVLCFTYSGLGLCSPSWSCILNHTKMIISVSGNLLTSLFLKFVGALTLRGSDVLSHPSVLSLVLEYSTLNRFNTDLMLLFKKHSSQQVHIDQGSFTKPCQA